MVVFQALAYLCYFVSCLPKSQVSKSRTGKIVKGDFDLRFKPLEVFSHFPHAVISPKKFRSSSTLVFVVVCIRLLQGFLSPTVVKTMVLCSLTSPRYLPSFGSVILIIWWSSPDKWKEYYSLMFRKHCCIWPFQRKLSLTKTIYKGVVKPDMAFMHRERKERELLTKGTSFWMVLRPTSKPIKGGTRKQFSGQAIKRKRDMAEVVSLDSPL